MTVADNDAYQQSTATGGETSFPYDFPITEDADLVVEVDGAAVTLNTDYTVTGAGMASGTILLDSGVYPSGATAGQVWTRYRDVPVTRSSNFGNLGSFDSDTVNTQLDRNILISQDLKRKVRRAPKFTEASGALDIDFPALVASRWLQVNTAGTGLQWASVVEPGTVTITAFAEMFLDDADAAAVLATLGAQADLDVPSQAEAEAGNATTERVWTAQRIGQAIAALGGHGGYYFHAHRNGVAQTITTDTYTKVQHTTEVSDSKNEFDSSTNYRYTPGRAGVYLVVAANTYQGLSDGKTSWSTIYKNGALLHSNKIAIGAATSASVTAVAFVPMNGTTDYIEHFTRHDEGSDEDITGVTASNFFQAAWMGPS